MTTATKNLSLSAQGNDLITKYRRAVEKLDWGFQILVDNEVEALKIGYTYRKHKHGYEIKYCEGVDKWAVTVFNEHGAKLFG